MKLRVFKCTKQTSSLPRAWGALEVLS